MGNCHTAAPEAQTMKAQPSVTIATSEANTPQPSKKTPLQLDMCYEIIHHLKESFGIIRVISISWFTLCVLSVRLTVGNRNERAFNMNDNIQW